MPININTFGQPQEQEKDFDLIDTAAQLVNGFIAGFSTFETGDSPKNEYEEIARSIGHLAGFVGYVPGFGSVGKVAAMGIGKAASMAVKGGKAATELGKLTKAAAEFKSVPMKFADFIIEKGSQYGGAEAVESAAKFMAKKGMSPKTIFGAKEIGYSMAHLGLASGGSAWQQDIGTIAEATLSGAMFGGVFKGLGVAMPGRGLPGRSVSENLKKMFIDPKTNALSPDGEGIMRVLSSSIASGLPSTLRDEATSMQIYEYLLGGFFGINEMGLPQKEAIDFQRTMQKRSKEDMFEYNPTTGWSTRDPERFKGWEQLSPEAKALIKEDSLLRGYNSYNAGDAVYNARVGTGATLTAEQIKVVRGMRLAKLDEMVNNGEISEADYRYRQMAEYQQYTEVGFKDRVDEIVSNINGDNQHEMYGKQESEVFDYAINKANKEFADKAFATLAGIKEKKKAVDTIKELMENSELGLNEKIASERDQAKEDLQEGAPGFVKPAEALSMQILMDKMEKGKTNKSSFTTEDFAKIQTEVAKTLREIKDLDWVDVEARIAKEFGVDMTRPNMEKENPVWSQLLRGYQRERQLVRFKEALVIHDPKKDHFSIVDAGNNDLKGNSIVNYKARHFLERILGTDVYIANLKKIWTRNEQGALVEVGFQKRKDSRTLAKDITLPRVMMSLYGQDKTILMGTKDSSSLIVTSFLEGARTPEEAYNKYVELQKSIEVNESRLARLTFEAKFNKLQREFVKEAIGKESFRRKVAENLFLQQYMNNWIVLAKTNSMSTEQYFKTIRSGDADMLSNPRKLNKRGSLFNNGFLSFDKSFFREIKDLNIDKGLNILFTNSINKTKGLTDIEGKEDLYRYNIKNGKVAIELQQAHKDGMFTLRSDVFNTMLLQGGLDFNTGAQKGTMVTTDPLHGLALGKYAYHMASPALDAEMFAKGIHGIMPDTAAKQRGKRVSYDTQYHPNAELGNRYTFHGKDGLPSNQIETYQIPIEDFTYTDGGEHYHNAMRNKGIPVQMLSNMRYDTHPNARKELDEMIASNFVGDAKSNELAIAHQANPNVDIKNLDVSKLGVQNIMDIIYSGSDTPLYRKVYKEILNVLKRESFDNDSVISDESEALRSHMESVSRPAEILLELWGINPAIMSTKIMSHYTEAIVKNYLLSKVMRPKAEGSFQAVMQPLTEEYRIQYDLQEGEILLAQRHANTLIPWSVNGDKAEITIAEALAQYKATEDKITNETSVSVKEELKKTLAKMADDLTIIVERVPTDSPSGVRALKIKGIYDIPGSGIIMHPEDMINASGADLDIDKAFGFTRFSKAFKDDVKKTHDEWYQYIDSKTGKVIDKNSTNPNKIKVMYDAKLDNNFFEEVKPKYSPWKKVGDKNYYKDILVQEATFKNKEGMQGISQINRDGRVILINKAALEKGFAEKVWTNPRKLIEVLDGKTTYSQAEALPVDAFKTVGEFLDFAIEHERQHFVLSREQYNAAPMHKNKLTPTQTMGVGEKVPPASSNEQIKVSGDTLPINITRGMYETEMNMRALAEIAADKADMEGDFWGMGDANTMGKVNENAVRGNSNLGIGISQAKVMEGMIEFFSNGGKVFIPGTKERKAITIDKTNIDIPTFRTAKRALINKSADAADGLRLKPQDQIGQELWNILTKFEGGSLKDVMRNSPEYNYLKTLNRIQGGRGRSLDMKHTGKSDETGVKATIGQLIEEVKYAKRKVSMTPEQMGNPFFKAVEQLSQLETRDYKDKAFLKANIENAAKAIEKLVLETQDAEATFGRKIGKGTKEDPIGFNFYSAIKNTDKYAQLLKISPEEAMRYVNELTFQDLADMNSPLVLLNARPKDYDAAELAKIHKKVGEFKERLQRIALEDKERKTGKERRTLSDAELEGDLSNSSLLAKEKRTIDAEIKKYKEDSITTKYHDFFDAALMSSFSYQDKLYQEFRAIKAAEIKAIFDKEMADLTAKFIHFGKPEEYAAALKLEQEQLRADYRDKEARLMAKTKSMWFSTNMSDFAFGMNNVSRIMKAKWGDAYSELVQKINHNVPPSELSILRGYVKDRYVTQDWRIPDGRATANLFLSLIPTMEKTSLENMAEPLKRKVEIANKKLVEVLFARPDLIPDIESRFAGEFLRRNDVTGFTGTKTLLAANTEEYLFFVDELYKAHTQKGKPMDIKGMYWWMNPTKTAEKIKYAEGSIVKEYALVEELDGMRVGEVQYLESKYKTISKMYSDKQTAEGARSSAIAFQFANSDMIKMSRALDTVEDGLGELFQDYSVLIREHRAGNKSQTSKYEKVNANARAAGIIPWGSYQYESIRNMPEGARTKKQQEYYDRITASEGEKDIPWVMNKEAQERYDAIRATYKDRNTEEYYNRYKAKEKEILALLNSPKKYEIPFLKRSMTAKEIMEFYSDRLQEWGEYSLNRLVSDVEATESFLTQPRKTNDKIYDKYGYIQLDRLGDALILEIQSGRPKFRSLELPERMKHQMLLELIDWNVKDYFVELVRKRMGDNTLEFETAKDVMEHIGFQDLIEEYKATGKLQDGNTFENLVFTYMRDRIGANVETLRISDILTREEKGQIWNSLKGREDIDSDNWIQYKPIVDRLPQWHKDHYFPHITFSDRALEARKVASMERILKGLAEGGASNQDLQRIQEEYINKQDRADELDTTDSSAIINLNGLRSVNSKNIKHVLGTFSNLLSRSIEDPLPEWSTNFDNLLKYETKVNKIYWDSITSFAATRLIERMAKEKPFGNNTDAWVNYLHLYNAHMVGGHSKLPEGWKENKALGLKGNPLFYLLTDQYTEDKIRKIQDKAFGSKMLTKKFPTLEKEMIEKALKNPQADTPEIRDAIRKLAYNDVSSKLALISNLEAKYELMTLLFQSKSYINNMMGGSINTIGAIGLDKFMKASDLNYLREQVFVDFKSMDDYKAFAEKHGAIESMNINQFGLDPLFKKRVFKKLAIKVMNHYKKGGEYSEQTMKELIKETGLSEKIMNTAAWFMRESEVRLRTRSWYAHYLAARETLNASGLVLEADHPWLIHWANRGVAATQFLYNNANRAPFARTHLGKIFTRFQLYNWNSLAFRRQIHSLASEQGYDPGTESFKRLERMVTADILVFALGKAFVMSAFDNTLPPPLSYLADFGQFFFGDDEEREKAYFGILPYPANIVGVAAPPISRIPFNLITALANGNTDRLANNVISWIPFGGMGKAIYRTIEAPQDAVKSFTGFPLNQIERYYGRAGSRSSRYGKSEISDLEE